MNIAHQLTVFFSCLFTLSASYADRSNTLSHAINAGEKFLTESVLTDNYALQCTSVNHLGAAISCPYDDAGKPVTGFFIAQALIANGKIPDNVRIKIMTALEDNEKRIDADAFYWGDNNTVYWGYAQSAPADSDDTSFALRTLLLLGKNINPAGLNEFYDANLHAYTTFKTAPQNTQNNLLSAIKSSIEHPPETNANVFALFQSLHLNAKINFSLIRRFQTKSGYWDSYFYPGKYYSTYMNMNVLCQQETNSQEIAQGLKFIDSTQNPNGSWGKPESAYDTALAVNTLISCHKQKSQSTTNGIAYLLKTQTKEGYWRNDQPIWEYTPNPDSSTPIKQTAWDKHSVLASALAIYALKQYK